MSISFRSWWLRVFVVLGMALANGLAGASDSGHYLITNDDAPANLLNGASIFSIAPNGQLKYQQTIRPGGNGIGGGYFGEDRVRVLSSGDENCFYFSEATEGDIIGVSIPDGSVGGSATGSPGDAGTTNGIGLALNSQYLYASFTDSNTIGTFQLESGCGLSFVNDISVEGLQGGVIDAMALHGNMLIATFGDGSIESFNISGGTPVPNGDLQNSTASVNAQFATYPSAIDITSDGHFAIFGDTSTAAVIEISDISSGQLTPTVVRQSPITISSSNILLSPDESLLYIVGTQGDRVGAVFFDKATGTISSGCISPYLKGYVADYSYLSGIAFESNQGTGQEVYVAEFGSPSSIAMVQVSASGGKCALTEAPGSPVQDPYSPGLLSIATYPPRSF